MGLSLSSRKGYRCLSSAKAAQECARSDGESGETMREHRLIDARRCWAEHSSGAILARSVVNTAAAVLPRDPYLG
jgi:hypothetical protein